jgi:hypothetical protein
MSLKTVEFINSTTTKIYVAYMYYDLACGSDCGDPWNVEGWIVLDPGERETRPNPTGNQFFLDYAEGDDGRIYDTGNYPAEVSNDVFEKCTCLGVSVSHGPQPYYTVGFQITDLNVYSGVQFFPPP